MSVSATAAPVAGVSDGYGGGNTGVGGSWLKRCRGSRRLVLVIVAIALLLDNMLLTTVVPIIPEFLYDIRHPNATLADIAANAATTTAALVTTLPPCSGYYPGNNASISKATTVPEYDNNSVAESPQEKEARHKELQGETVEVGLMFASKAFVQLLVNPIVGPLTHKIGYSIPMFTGFIIMFLSTIIFAFGRSYFVLVLARALQGIGSSCSSVSGMGMLAERYTDDKERGNAMGIALGGLALGVLIGPPFGGVMYEFVGKSAPFLVLAALALGDGLLQLLVLQPAVVRQETDPPSLKALIMDPYIVIAAGAITFANMGIAMLEPSLPIWMMDNMEASRWEQGVTFLPASISYLIGTNLFGPLGHRMGRWLAAMLGLFIIGLCLMLIPLASSINHLILPNAGLGFAIGMVDSSMMPELGYLVDIRHGAVYGSVYALGDVAFCLGFAIGPAMSGTLVNTIGFEWMLMGIAVLNFAYAPLLYFLRAPPTKEEKTLGDGLFLETARHVSKDYPEILHDDIIIDNCCMQLVSNPHQFDIINTMNLYGPIISHIVSGLSGGAGLFAGRNYGDNYAVFEPGTRSTGSTISGNNVANPVAMLNASVDMLHHLGHCEHAECIRKAIITILNQDKLLTPG